MKILILDRALEHIRDGSSFYERRGPGVGSYFRLSILADIKRLRKTAGVHPVFLGKYHRCISQRFLFAIYYRFNKDYVRIHAVLDSRHHPDRIRQQLT